MFITPADVDAKIKSLFASRTNPDLSIVGVARCRLPRKKVDIFTQNDLRNHRWTTSTIIHIIFFSYIASLCRTFTEKSNFKANVAGA